MAPLLSTRQANFTEPDALALSVAVIVTVLYCRLVGVPLIVAEPVARCRRWRSR
jgi:hypothetical protein